MPPTLKPLDLESFQINSLYPFITPMILWVVLLVVAALSVIAGATLLYHWNTYSIDPRKMRTAKLRYITVSWILLVIMLGAAVYY